MQRHIKSKTKSDIMGYSRGRQQSKKKQKTGEMQEYLSSPTPKFCIEYKGEL